ncbi:MAG: hypothetical protein SGI99_02730 [Pseudomonadota bacterium]|nr:hypothetical protein [Pseudomonadota bacterium]
MNSANAMTPPAARAKTTTDLFARLGLWSALAFVLNLIWETAHVRLYTLWAAADAKTVAWSLLHCSLGDVVIALAMFALAGILLWNAGWPNSRPRAGSAIVVTCALAYTTWSEWYNVYSARNWAYAESMPLIFGVGISPFLQWLILPPVMVGIYRRLAPILFDQLETTNPASTTFLTGAPP